jgi:hypothetical protein
MFGPAVAIENDIGYVMGFKMKGNPARICDARSQIPVERPCPGPFSLVSRIEGNSPHFGTSRGQPGGQSMEERAMRSLQEEKNAPGPSVHLPQAPLTN